MYETHQEPKEVEPKLQADEAKGALSLTGGSDITDVLDLHNPAGFLVRESPSWDKTKSPEENYFV